MGNFLGAFADAAILFPLLAIMPVSSGNWALVPLASAGFLYIAAGIFYRSPMSIQPLKSIVIAGVAVGATFSEIHWSGALVGVFCLLLWKSDVDVWAAKIPRSIIHGVQLGLGLMLLFQASKYLSPPTLLPGIILLTALTVLVPGIPVLGALGTLAVLMGLTKNDVSLYTPMQDQTRWSLILSLTLPQIALTLSNSVLATQDVAHRYFGSQAKAVTPRRLLGFIGLGNILMALIGGLPFCHGSGGLTAHYRGGARHFVSNFVIGIFILSLAALQLHFGNLHLKLPQSLLALLLGTTGIFHIQLARPTWEIPEGKLKLLAMGAVAIFTQNLLWVLATGLALEGVAWFRTAKL